MPCQSIEPFTGVMKNFLPETDNGIEPFTGVMKHGLPGHRTVHRHDEEIVSLKPTMASCRRGVIHHALTPVARLSGRDSSRPYERTYESLPIGCFLIDYETR